LRETVLQLTSALRRCEREPIAATIVRLGAGRSGGECNEHRDRLPETFQPYVLSLFRFITGLLLFQYGVVKLVKLPAGTMFDKVELF
jgi:hypothetical protein